MSISTFLKRVDRRYAWSFLGFILALFFGCLTIYIEYFRDNRPQVKFEIVSDASVLDVKENIGNLEVLYDGIDLQKTQKTLRVLIFRIKNDGAVDILKSTYDDKNPFGFKISNGTIVKHEITSTSSDYIKNNLKITTNQTTGLTEPLIFESQEWFTIKLLIISTDGFKPRLEPVGKIAGVKDVKVVDITTPEHEQGFLKTAFYAKPGIQAIRAFVYFFGFVISIITIISPFVIISEIVSKRNRKKIVAKFKATITTPRDSCYEFVFKQYINNDIAWLKTLNRTLSNPNRLTRGMRHMERLREVDTIESTEIYRHELDRDPRRQWRLLEATTISEMIELGHIENNEGNLIVNPKIHKAITELTQFIGND